MAKKSYKIFSEMFEKIDNQISNFGAFIRSKF